MQRLVLELVRERDQQQSDPEVIASDYWQDFCAHLRYVFELGVDELGWIRRHTYYLTSDICQRYYFATADRGPFTWAKPR